MDKKIKKQTPRKVFAQLQALYSRMQEEYDSIASQTGLSCADCTDNCCTSFFQHHTYVEWAYFWKGLEACEQGLQERIQERAREYVREEDKQLKAGLTPHMMCPVNDGGWCALYPYRLMICRMHGVPNRLRTPDGRFLEFPGCHVTQELTENMDEIPTMDRTPFYTELAGLEMSFLGPNKIKRLPKVDMTLARMIVSGPPNLKS